MKPAPIETVVAFDTSKLQLAFELILIPATMVIISIAACFLVYLVVMMLRGYFPVVAMVSKEDSDLVDALIEAQTKIRNK